MVVIHADVHVLQALAVGFGAGLAVEVGNDNAVYAEVTGQEFVPQAQHIHIIGNAKVRADLVFLYVYGRYYDDDL